MYKDLWKKNFSAEQFEMIWMNTQFRKKNKLKAIDYDIQWAAREKENILTAWERLQEENR